MGGLGGQDRDAVGLGGGAATAVPVLPSSPTSAVATAGFSDLRGFLFSAAVTDHALRPVQPAGRVCMPRNESGIETSTYYVPGIVALAVISATFVNCPSPSPSSGRAGCSSGCGGHPCRPGCSSPGGWPRPWPWDWSWPCSWSPSGAPGQALQRRPADRLQPRHHRPEHRLGRPGGGGSLGPGRRGGGVPGLPVGAPPELNPHVGGGSRALGERVILLV